MNLFGVGPTEIFVILIVILVLFGPERLPEIAKKIGGASREIRDNLNSMNDQMNSALEASMEFEKAQMQKPVDATANETSAPSIAAPAEPAPEASAEQNAVPENPPAPDPKAV